MTQQLQQLTAAKIARQKAELLRALEAQRKEHDEAVEAMDMEMSESRPQPTTTISIYYMYLVLLPVLPLQRLSLARSLVRGCLSLCSISKDLCWSNAFN